jgi:hypothetical protein
MGVQRGWPDLLLFSPSGQLHALELKRVGGRLTADQEAFAAWCATADVPHAVVWSVDDAIQHLRRWGALRGGVGTVARWPRQEAGEPVGKFSDLPDGQ